MKEEKKFDVIAARRVHVPHRGGGGRHKHKLASRNRTRSQQNSRAIGEKS